RGIVDEIVYAIDFAAELERMAAYDVGEIIDELRAPLIRQRVPLQKGRQAEGKISAPVCIGLRRRRIADLVFEIAAPLETDLVHFLRSESRGEPQVVGVDAYIIGAISPDVPEHDRRLNRAIAMRPHVIEESRQGIRVIDQVVDLGERDV